jgi:hypothetical protein
LDERQKQTYRRQAHPPPFMTKGSWLFTLAILLNRPLFEDLTRAISSRLSSKNYISSIAHPHAEQLCITADVLVQKGSVKAMVW